MGLRTSHHEEEENHERWLISYADFITLLFAFFVVMYAVSSVNDGKYRVLSDSLESAFHDPLTRLMPIDLGGGRRVSGIMEGGEGTASVVPTGGALNELEEASLDPNVLPSPVAAGSLTGVDIGNMRDAGSYLREHLTGVMDDERFNVRDGDNWLQIELQSEFLFRSGSADMQAAAADVLSEIAPVLQALPGEIRVEGFTDDQPIATARFPSNWELSGARAGSIVRYFGRTGIDPARMAAVGYGEHRPIADNASAEGRQSNRRVVISVAAAPDLAMSDISVSQAAGGIPVTPETPLRVNDPEPVIVLQRVSGIPGPIGIQ